MNFFSYLRNLSGKYTDEKIDFMEQITSTEFKSGLLSEVQVSLKLAVPIVVTQIAQTGINAVNVVMMGILGSHILAAGALGAITFVTLLFICYGILSTVGALAAEAFGANKIDQVSRVFCQALWLAGAISLPAMLLIWYCDSLLSLVGQEESNMLLMQIYLRSIVWGFPAALGILVLKDVASAVNIPQVITVIMLSSLLLVAPTNYILMFGKLGFPALGLAGIGWGTAFIFWVAFIAAVALLYFHPKVKDDKLFGNLLQFDREIFVKIIQTGWPLGFQVAAETALLNVSAWLMGYLGTVILAAHEIATQTTEICMVIPMGINYAVLTRVGKTMGEKNPLGARRAAEVGIAFGALFTSVVAIFLWLFSEQIVGIYLDINNPDNTEVIKTGASFLKLAALFQIFYGIQVIIAAALVGLQDTLIPTLINLASWGVGIGGSYVMGIIWGWGGVGIWCALILSPAISGVILLGRFYLLESELIGKFEREEQGA